MHARVGSAARSIVFAPLHVEGAAERIVRRIGEAIGAGLLEPGERLPAEQELAAMLEVAPMTLRQALSVLRDAGFVETRRGRGGGSFVAVDPQAALGGDGRVPSAAEIRDLTDWRCAVSGEASSLAAARADHQTVAAIAAAADAVADAVDDFGASRVADARFHLAIAEASGNRRLLAAETAIQSELGEIVAVLPGHGSRDALASSFGGHPPLVAAIAHGDPIGARAALVQHAEATHDWVLGLSLGRG